MKPQARKAAACLVPSANGMTLTRIFQLNGPIPFDGFMPRKHEELQQKSKTMRVEVAIRSASA